MLKSAFKQDRSSIMSPIFARLLVCIRQGVPDSRLAFIPWEMAHV